VLDVAPWSRSGAAPGEEVGDEEEADDQRDEE
jgi:hypothetical protein